MRLKQALQSESFSLISLRQAQKEEMCRHLYMLLVFLVRKSTGLVLSVLRSLRSQQRGRYDLRMSPQPCTLLMMKSVISSWTTQCYFLSMQSFYDILICMSLWSCAKFMIQLYTTERSLFYRELMVSLIEFSSVRKQRSQKFIFFFMMFSSEERMSSSICREMSRMLAYMYQTMDLQQTIRVRYLFLGGYFMRIDYDLQESWVSLPVKGWKRLMRCFIESLSLGQITKSGIWKTHLKICSLLWGGWRFVSFCRVLKFPRLRDKAKLLSLLHSSRNCYKVYMYDRFLIYPLAIMLVQRGMGFLCFAWSQKILLSISLSQLGAVNIFERQGTERTQLLSFFISMQVYVPTRNLLAVSIKSKEQASSSLSCRWRLYLEVRMVTQREVILSLPSTLSSQFPSEISLNLFSKMVLMGILSLRKLLCRIISDDRIEIMPIILDLSFFISLGSLGARMRDLSMRLLINGLSISYFMMSRFYRCFLDISRYFLKSSRSAISHLRYCLTS